MIWVASPCSRAYSAGWFQVVPKPPRDDQVVTAAARLRPNPDYLAERFRAA